VSAEGTVSLRGSAAMVERVVRWSAARDVGLATGSMPWDGPAEELFSKAAATALRLLGGQGRLLVGAGRMPAAFSDPVLAVAAESDRKRVRRTAEAEQAEARPRAVGGRKKKEGKHERLLPRDLHDAPAAIAIIRSGWERNAIRVLLEYRDSVPHLEIAVGDRLLVDGPWQWRASKGGQPLEMEGPWSVSCWESDKKATYLEIIAPLAKLRPETSRPEMFCRNRCGAMPTAGCEWNRSCRWPPRSRASRRRIPVRSSFTTRSSG
jgi:hypothetical protein